MTPGFLALTQSDLSPLLSPSIDRSVHPRGHLLSQLIGLGTGTARGEANSERPTLAHGAGQVMFLQV